MREKKSNTKKRICVIGLKNNQINKLESECGEIAELRFLDPRRSAEDIPQCDYVILMPKFIAKRWTRGAYDAMDRDRVRLNWGGVSGLINQIKTLLA